MATIGYWLSSEEHAPNALVHHAQRAEELGFTFAMISDHYHPWIDRQGHAPFVWSIIGGIAHATEQLHLGTGVTCPIIRIHPAIIAQAAATAATMMPGRFFLGVGTGERLNEHILGEHWPPADVRQEMLEEAITVIRLLWQGGTQSHDGYHYTVENARIYTLPDETPPIVVAASGPKAAELAGRVGDGLVGIGPDADLVDEFNQAGGKGKPHYGKLTVCWAPSESDARRMAYELWPTDGLPGALHQELALPAHYEQAVSIVTEEAIGEKIVCGPDPERHIAAIEAFVKAGFDHVAIHQIGPDQEGFFHFYEHEVLPHIM